VRAATLNLWGRSGAWEERRRVLADGFAALRPDVVLLQEAADPAHVAEVLGPELEAEREASPSRPRAWSRRWPASVTWCSPATWTRRPTPPASASRAAARGPALEIADCRLLFAEPPWASDHFGVVADLRPF
jgi:endonuclease/exonuclease/phosphatase family metal-dependent hydrolase